MRRLIVHRSPASPPFLNSLAPLAGNLGMPVDTANKFVVAKDPKNHGQNREARRCFLPLKDRNAPENETSESEVHQAFA
jgi:hypothetical protein